MHAFDCVGAHDVHTNPPAVRDIGELPDQRGEKKAAEGADRALRAVSLASFVTIERIGEHAIAARPVQRPFFVSDILDTSDTCAIPLTDRTLLIPILLALTDLIFIRVSDNVVSIVDW